MLVRNAIHVQIFYSVGPIFFEKQYRRRKSISICKLTLIFLKQRLVKKHFAVFKMIINYYNKIMVVILVI